MKAHHSVCPKFPLGCPGGCGAMGLTRSTVEKHVEEDCPKTLVACPVPNCPMSNKIERMHLAAHLEGGVRAHIEALMDRITSIEDASRHLGQMFEESNARLVSDLKRLKPLEDTATQLAQRVKSLEESNARLTAGNAALLRSTEADRSEIVRLNQVILRMGSIEEYVRRQMADDPIWQALQFERNPAWDPNDKDPCLQLADGNTTVMSSDRSFRSILGPVGFSAGVHRWRVKINRRGAIVLGVHPKPRPGDNDYRTAYGVGENEDVSRGPLQGWKCQDNGITMDPNDVVCVVLNCDAHTLTVTNPSSTCGRTSVFIDDLARGVPLFPYASISGAVDRVTSLTLMPY